MFININIHIYKRIARNDGATAAGTASEARTSEEEMSHGLDVLKVLCAPK